MFLRAPPLPPTTQQPLHLRLGRRPRRSPQLPRRHQPITVHLLHDNIFRQIGLGGRRAIMLIQRLQRADADDALADDGSASGSDVGKGHDTVRDDLGLGEREQRGEGPGEEAGGEGEAEGGGVAHDLPGLGGRVGFGALGDLGVGFLG